MAAGTAAAMLSVDDAGEAAGEGWGDDDDDDAVQEGDTGEGESNGAVKICLCMRACMRVRVCMRVHACMRARACVRVRARACMCVRVYVHTFIS